MKIMIGTGSDRPFDWAMEVSSRPTVHSVQGRSTIMADCNQRMGVINIMINNSPPKTCFTLMKF